MFTPAVETKRKNSQSPNQSLGVEARAKAAASALRRRSNLSASPESQNENIRKNIPVSPVKEETKRLSGHGRQLLQQSGTPKARTTKKSAPTPIDRSRHKHISPRMSPRRKRDILDHEGWLERKTADGVSYYHNGTTGELTWDMPDEMKNEGQIEYDSGNWVWFPDSTDGYVPAQVINRRNDGRVEVQLENGETAVSRRGQTLAKLVRSSLAKLERDLVLLDSLDEGLILFNLRERFLREQQIYTNVGTILISINPYETFPIYTLEQIEKYKNRGNRVLDPHVYTVADEALKPLLEYGENHSILISGESGAGKTWNTKQCLSYITEVTGKMSRRKQDATDLKEASIETKILAANPILEAFGNAKTVRNDNSSRFGRFTEVHFVESGTIEGARIENFLLEKSRVVWQQSGERNYHIFYQLCSSDYATSYGIGSVETNEYMNQSGCYTVDSIDDREDFDVMLQSMTDLNFSKIEIEWVLQQTAAGKLRRYCFTMGR